MKHRILFVTQTLGEKAACGIGIIGKLIGETLQQHPNYEFDVLYCDSPNEVMQKLHEWEPRVAIYNYAPGTTPWMNDRTMRAPFPNIKHVRIMHDMHQGIATTFHPALHQGWEYLLADDPSVVGNDHVFITNRLIPPGPTVEYVEPAKPIIGFQGFGPPHKGIARLAHKVQEEFDEAVLRLHIPFGYYEDLIHGYKGSNAYARVAEVKQIITKPGIDVEFSHDLLETQEIVNLLAQNTINCYFYDYLDGCGIASSPDYALAAKRPIAVSRSHQMRNFWGIPEVLIENNSIKEIIARGTAPLEPLYKAYSKESVWADYSAMLEKLIRD